MLVTASESVDNSRVTVVRNARKSAARTRRFADALRASGLSVEVVSTHSVEEGENAGRAAVAAGASVLIAAGGDGTVRSLLPAVVGSQTALGILPLGTSNDLALEIGVATLNDAVATVVGARARTWDVSTCTYRTQSGEPRSALFCSTAGVGLLANVLSMSQSGFGALMKRVLGNAVWPPLVTASTCFTRAKKCTLEVDDQRLPYSLMLLEISKLRSAGGIPLTPDARGDSGMLHAWTVNQPGFWGCTKILFDSLSGSMRHLEHQQVDYFSRDASQNRMGATRVRRIAIEGEARMPVHVHGDHVGNTPASFELTSLTFQLLVPAELAGNVLRVGESKAPRVPSTFPAAASPRAARMR